MPKHAEIKSQKNHITNLLIETQKQAASPPNKNANQIQNYPPKKQPNSSANNAQMSAQFDHPTRSKTGQQRDLTPKAKIKTVQNGYNFFKLKKFHNLIGGVTSTVS